ncbi:MAG: DUF1614 domain-containing protein [Thermoplasmata archaeon]
MVDPWVLTNDTIAGIGSVVLTPLLWIGLFVWAWMRPADARASGFGRMAFWLLLPGAFLSSLADVPFLPWAGDVLAINIGGALIPIVLTLVLLHRELSTPGWYLTGTVILIVAAETATQFVIVVLTSSFWTELLVLVTAAGTVAFAIGALPRWTTRPAALRAVTFVSLVSVAISLTFFSSQAVPGVGIVSEFPYYLVGPVLVGVVGAWVASAVWGVSAFRGLGVAYGSGTLGTLIGADVLRQPPLYTGAGGELLAIGGAGVQDLVYLSGLMAVGVGLLVIFLRFRGAPADSSVSAPAPPSPYQALRSAAGRLAKGDPAGVMQDSVTASQGATDRVRSIYRLPAPEQLAAAWDGLPVAPYVVHDYRNLIASKDEPNPTPREAYRSLAMATQFVRLGRDLSRLRFAAAGRRGWAAVVDLLLVTAPAVVLWTLLAFTQPGGLEAILNGLPFNLAVIGYVGYGVLYYVVCDALFGTTVGKFLFHLTVTDRAWARPTTLQSFLREAPKAVPIFVIGELGAPALLFLLLSGRSSFNVSGIDLALNGALLLGIVIVTVALALALGGLQVARDSERQRLGDRWASTWVVDRRVVTPAWGATRSPSAVPPGACPPG